MRSSSVILGIKSESMKLKTLNFSLAVVLVCNCAITSDPWNHRAGRDNPMPAITIASAELPLEAIKLPSGFSITVFAEAEDARSMAMSPSGTLFIGNRDGDKVYAVKDTDGDGKADKKWVVASGLDTPNGVAFK